MYSTDTESRVSPVGLSAACFVLAALVAVRTSPIILHDDFAILARYASRIASGDGWTYNPGDRTNGASAPLYTALLATLRALGFDVVGAARGIGVVSYAACVAMVAYLGTRLVGLVGGCLSAFFLLTWLDFGVQGLSGMESALAAALGLGVILAVVNERDTLAGIILGLALLTKLDAGLLALAVGVSWVLVRRAFPWRIAWVSAAVLVPWVAFSTLYFGTPLPNSMTSKLSGAVDNPAIVFDQFWIVDTLRDQRVTLLVLLAFGAVAVIIDLRRTSAVLACGLSIALMWPIFHATAFSVIDFGDRFTWYLTVLYPPLSLCAGCTVGWAVARARSGSKTVFVGALAAAILVVGLALNIGRSGASPPIMAVRVRHGSYSNEYLEFERVRREAGRRVAEMAEPGDVIATCFGWVAFEALENPIRESCPLNTRKKAGPVRWVVTGTYPGNEPPESLEYDAVPVLELLVPPLYRGRMDIGRVEDPDPPNS